MKFALVLGYFSIGARPLDFNDLFGSSRGLTGTELGIVMQAKELAALGHDVSLFTVFTDNAQPESWENVKLFSITELHSEFDVVVSWNEPDVFRGINGPLRVCAQMMNDFTYCGPGFEDLVDLWAVPSQRLLEHLAPQMQHLEKLHVIPLGCQPDWYGGDKVSGRVIWASSADRGLHNLLQEWHKIKAAVPHAHLRIFYNFNFGNLFNIENGADPWTLEVAQRVRYMWAMINRLQHLDVQLLGSVSRLQINKEMSEAQVLAFPCDTVRFTEGFSCATLEGCAAAACPVISDVDALGSIYGGVVPMVQSPVPEHLEQVSELVIKALTDKSYRDSVNEKCVAFAATHTWTEVTKQLVRLIEEFK